jgi:hypothetical protein
MSAAQRVCAIPELGSIIIEFIASPGSSGSQANIYSCARVNRLWFWLAMSHLWSQLNWQKLQSLGRMPMERKRLHASFVKSLSLDFHPSSKYQSQMLDRLVFSRVLPVNIRIWDHLSRGYIPQIQAPALQVLDLSVYKIKVDNGHVLSNGDLEERFANFCKVRTLFLVMMQARDFI